MICAQIQALWSADFRRLESHYNELKFTAGTAGAAAAAGSFGSLLTTFVKAQPRALRIMTWAHFVPWAYHPWFDNFTREWARSKGIEVTIDRVSFADIVPRATAEVAAQQGHDIYFFISPPSQFEQQVLDLADINNEAARRYGPILPVVKDSTYNPHTRKWFGFSDNWVPDPGDYLKSVWSAVGYTQGPRTWEDLLTAGRQIKQKYPNIQIPIGVTIHTAVMAIFTRLKGKSTFQPNFIS